MESDFHCCFIYNLFSFSIMTVAMKQPNKNVRVAQKRDSYAPLSGANDKVGRRQKNNLYLQSIRNANEK